MLTCVFHPIDPMRVEEDDVANTLLASGVWFDSPAKARAYRDQVESEIKSGKSPTKPVKGKTNER